MSNTLKERTWTHPGHYGGHSPEGDYVIYTRHRDSGPLDNSNYEATFERLLEVAYGDKDAATCNACEDGCCPVYDFRARHWAVGWVEYIIVKASAPQRVLDEAEGILGALSNYPVLDEEDFSRREDELVTETWDTLPLADRVHYCQRAGESVFAARARGDNLYSRAPETYDALRDSVAY